MPNLCLLLGISPTLFTFSFLCLITSVWSWCVIPETRGLTLTQVLCYYWIRRCLLQISLAFSGRKETAEEREAEERRCFYWIICTCICIIGLFAFAFVLLDYLHLYLYLQVEARLLHMGARSRMPRMESFTNSIGWQLYSSFYAPRNIFYPVHEIGFGPPNADFGSIWSSQKMRKFQHCHKTSKVRILYFDPPIT